jgi:hypothetical protein
MHMLILIEWQGIILGDIESLSHHREPQPPVRVTAKTWLREPQPPQRATASVESLNIGGVLALCFTFGQ